jgi:hypothetical protein
MTFIDRYLAAVGENLPRGQRDDILRELADDLHARADDRAATLGRPLRPEEEADLLRDMGEPMTVAARFRADDHGLAFGRRLIGPELFPSYVRVLGINLVITVVVGVLLAIAGVRAGFEGAIAGVAVTFGIQFAIVTAIFVAIDRRYVARPDAWDPLAEPGGYPPEAILDDLADTSSVRDGRVSRVASTVELAWLVIVLGWWLAMPAVASRFTPFEPGLGWTAVFVPGLVVFAIWFAQSLVNLARPDLLGYRTVMRVIGEGATIIVAALSLSIGDWLVLAGPAPAPIGALDLENVVESIIGVSLVGVVIVSALSIVGEVRSHRRRTAGGR